MSNHKQNTFLSWLYDGALFVGIVGVLLFFVNYGLELLYPAPEYDDFCDDRTVQPADDLTQKQCEAIGGRWQSQNFPIPAESQSTAGTATGTVTTTATTTTQAGYCERDYVCRQEYNAAQITYDRTAFAILSVLGLLVASWGFVYGTGSILGASAAAGGILLILVSTVRFWDQAESWLQFGLLFLILIVFIYFGYQREQDE